MAVGLAVSGPGTPSAVVEMLSETIRGLHAMLADRDKRIGELEHARQEWCTEATAHVQRIGELERALGEERNGHRVAYAGLLARCGRLEQALDDALRKVPVPC